MKYGDGAFMRRPSDAVKLAELMVRIGTAAGRKVGAAVTCMDTPLGDCVGCNAEVREAIEVLKGKRTRWRRFRCTIAAKFWKCRKD